MARTAEPTGAGKAPAVTQPSHEAEAQAAALLRSIYARVRTMLHPHHAEHEPGGKDQIKIPLGFLRDVTYSGLPTTSEVLVYNVDHWENGSASATQTKHGAYLYVSLPAEVGAVSPPGPKNVSGAAHTVTAVTVTSDGAVAGTMTGGSFSFSAGGGETDTTGLSTNWANGDRLAVTISSCGTDGTYLVIDWAVS